MGITVQKPCISNEMVHSKIIELHTIVYICTNCIYLYTNSYYSIIYKKYLNLLLSERMMGKPLHYQFITETIMKPIFFKICLYALDYPLGLNKSSAMQLLVCLFILYSKNKKCSSSDAIEIKFAHQPIRYNR